MRHTALLDPDDSLTLAATKLRENGAPIVPVCRDHVLLGIVSEDSLADAIGSGSEVSEAISARALVAAPTIRPYATGAEALRLFERSRTPLVVVDDTGRTLGLLAPSDLFGRRAQHLIPPMVGGMATPFGVYLTTGNARGGAGHLALMATGGLLFLLYFLAGLTGPWIYHWTAGLIPAARAFIAETLPLVVFFGGMRLLPLAGIHAAEHKVVHAIERGEDLTAEAVRRMPRIHPRCGTNIAVGASLFLGLGTSTWIASPELRLMLAGLLTLMLWRPLGTLVQRYITTKPPSPRHIEMGIRSGRELLENYAKARTAIPTLGERLVNSGMFHVIAGSVITFFALAGLNALFGLGLPIEV
jgi:hypothetical protein